MGKASDFYSEDCGFESRRGCPGRGRARGLQITRRTRERVRETPGARSAGARNAHRSGKLDAKNSANAGEGEFEVTISPRPDGPLDVDYPHAEGCPARPAPNARRLCRAGLAHPQRGSNPQSPGQKSDAPAIGPRGLLAKIFRRDSERSCPQTARRGKFGAQRATPHSRRPHRVLAGHPGAGRAGQPSAWG